MSVCECVRMKIYANLIILVVRVEKGKWHSGSVNSLVNYSHRNMMSIIIDSRNVENQKFH